uniref:Myb/SANT-like domain-containing protein n=1 Tax=Oryza nivara TaxID=4536 RepID=A0A0E0GVI3_ORYNI
MAPIFLRAGTYSEALWHAYASKMGGGNAYWDDRLTKIFPDICIAEKEKLNYNKKGLTKVGWQNVYRNFREQTCKNYDSKQLQNKSNTLKRQHSLWKKLKNKSGAGWDNNTGTIRCDDDWWEDRIEEDREAKQFRHKPLAHEDELTILFGSMDDVEDGIGDRTPCGGSEDNCTPIPTGHVGLSEDNAGRSSVGREAQRAGKEQVVDSPPPKKTKNMEYYVERISESMLEKSRNESSVIRGEQEEVTELLLQVEQDGVAQGSELYYIATDLFRSPARRAAFRCIRAPEHRIGWLRWTWDNARKNSSPLRKRWSKPSKEIKTRMSSSETSSSTSSSGTHFRDEWSTWWDMGAIVGVLAALASSSSGGCDLGTKDTLRVNLFLPLVSVEPPPTRRQLARPHCHLGRLVILPAHMHSILARTGPGAQAKPKFHEPTSWATPVPPSQLPTS